MPPLKHLIMIVINDVTLPWALSCPWRLFYNPHWENGGSSQCSYSHGFYKLKGEEKTRWQKQTWTKKREDIRSGQETHAARWIPFERQCWRCLRKGSTEASSGLPLQQHRALWIYRNKKMMLFFGRVIKTDSYVEKHQWGVTSPLQHLFKSTRS